MKSSLKKSSNLVIELVSSPVVIFSLLIFSFEFKVANLTRLIFVALILILKIYGLRASGMRIGWPTPLYFVIAICVSFSIFHNHPARALQFLSYGYDNAFHFTIFRGFIETNWFPNVDLNSWFTDFQLFRKVPLGYYGIISFLNYPFKFFGTNSASSLIFFAWSQIFLIFLLIWLVFKFLKEQRKEKLSQDATNAFLSAMIVICIASTLLVNGFAPYFCSLVIILFWLNYDSGIASSWRKNLTISLSIYSIMMISPAPATLLFIPAINSIIHDYILMRKSGKKIEFLLSLAPFLIIGTLVLMSFNRSSSGLGWRQLLQTGGLQNINLLTSSILITIAIYLLIRNWKKIPKDALSQILISGFLSVVALSVLNIMFTGKIQYYAIKQMYILLFFISIYLAKTFIKSNYKVILTGTLAFLLLIPILNPNYFKGGYMGVFPRAIQHVFNSEIWKLEPVNAAQILQIDLLKGLPDNTCYIWRPESGFQDSDLSSRWINSLKDNNMITENCFAAYWNNMQLSDQELQDKLHNLKGNYVIFTELDNVHANIDNLSYRIIMPQN